VTLIQEGTEAVSLDTPSCLEDAASRTFDAVPSLRGIMKTIRTIHRDHENAVLVLV
jgi:hypothetical protein